MADTGTHALAVAHGGGAAQSRASMEIEGADQPGRGRVPAWLLVVALLSGGGAGGGVAAALGFGDRGIAVDVAQARMDLATHKTRLDSHDRALEAATERQANTQRWLADVLVRQSAAIGGIAEKVGAKVDVTVPQLIAEGR